MERRLPKALANSLDNSGLSRSVAMQIRFGECSLHTDSRQLRRGDAERHLSPKAFELLRLLLENRPRALSKAELHERLWPSTFVSEATLSSLVAEVREALGERAGSAGFVRTVHRFGYAFSGTAAEQKAPDTSSPRQARCWVIWEHGQVPLPDGEHLLGRDADVAVWLESPTISRHHARIRVAGAAATIEDLGSKNGTFLRGQRLAGPSPLTDGDDLTLGSIPVKIRLLTRGGSTVTQGVT
jgi:DNA-binding winged helix-turn-helix (wHTH) protein